MEVCGGGVEVNLELRVLRCGLMSRFNLPRSGLDPERSYSRLNSQSIIHFILVAVLSILAVSPNPAVFNLPHA